jgi:hypothetical protein
MRKKKKSPIRSSSRVNVVDFFVDGKKKFIKKEKRNRTVLLVSLLVIGALVIAVPLLVRYNKLKLFTINPFNFTVLILLNVALYLVDWRIGVITTVLLLSLLIYAKLEGLEFTTLNNNTTLDGDYKNQFDLPSNGLNMYNKMVPPTPNVHKTMDNDVLVNDPTSTTLAEVPKPNTVSEIKTNENTNESEEGFNVTMPNIPNDGNVASYMKQLEKDSLNNELKSETYGYDVAGCRYDGFDEVQTTTTYGPPLNDAKTYSGENVNGQLFYPMS